LRAAMRKPILMLILETTEEYLISDGDGLVI